MNSEAPTLAAVDLPSRVQSTLARCPYFLGRRLNAEVDGDRVVLSGVVDTYYLKQFAQESIRDVEGVGQIQNDIDVQSLS